MLDLARKKISIFSIVKLCARYSPMLFVMCLVLTVIDGLLVPLMLVVVANFINSAITLTSENPQTYILMKNAIFMGLGYFYMQLSQEFKLYFYELFEDTLRNKLKPDIIKKQFSMDYLLFEGAQTQDLLLRELLNHLLRLK